MWRIGALVAVLLIWSSNTTWAVLTSEDSEGDSQEQSQIVSSYEYESEVESKAKQKRKGSMGTMSISMRPKARRSANTQSAPEPEPASQSFAKPQNAHPHSTQHDESSLEVRTVRSKHKPANTVRLTGRAYPSGGGGTISGSGGASTVRVTGTASGSRRIQEGSES